MLPSKWENLSRSSIKLFHFCKKLPLIALDTGRNNIFCKYNIHIFSNLDVAFAVPFLCYLQKLQLLVIKTIWNNFCCIVLLFVWAQKVCLRFLKSYFKLEILIFLSFAVSFLVDMFNWRAPFLTKRISAVKSETHFSRKAIEN